MFFFPYWTLQAILMENFIFSTVSWSRVLWLIFRYWVFTDKKKEYFFLLLLVFLISTKLF